MKTDDKRGWYLFRLLAKSINSAKQDVKEKKFDEMIKDMHQSMLWHYGLKKWN